MRKIKLHQQTILTSAAAGEEVAAAVPLDDLEQVRGQDAVSLVAAQALVQVLRAAAAAAAVCMSVKKMDGVKLSMRTNFNT